MEEMTEEQSRRVLRSARIGHLGLADGGRAYVIPIHFAFDGRFVWFHSHPGVKDEFVRSTKEACFAVTRALSDDEWESVLAFGQVERVQATTEILAGMDALMRIPPPPKAGQTPRGQPVRTDRDAYVWRLSPRLVTGRRSSPPAPHA